jgi:ABC-type protease/lipase transport system fused ATPase/permease subunit
MSPPDEAAKLSVLLVELQAQIERTEQAGEIASVLPGGVTNLVSGAVKLYAAMVEDAALGAGTVPVINGTVSTTEAMVMACALLRAHHLNPFDLALWFSRTAPVHRRSADDA